MGPDLDPNCLTLLIVFLKEIFEKFKFEKCQQVTKIPEEITALKELKLNNACLDSIRFSQNLKPQMASLTFCMLGNFS